MLKIILPFVSICTLSLIGCGQSVNQPAQNETTDATIAKANPKKTPHVLNNSPIAKANPKKAPAGKDKELRKTQELKDKRKKAEFSSAAAKIRKLSIAVEIWANNNGAFLQV